MDGKEAGRQRLPSHPGLSRHPCRLGSALEESRCGWQLPLPFWGRLAPGLAFGFGFALAQKQTETAKRRNNTRSPNPIHRSAHPLQALFFFSAGRALRRGNVGSARPSISKCTSNAANVGRPRVPAPRRPSWVHANRCAPAEGRQATFPPPSGSDSAPLARGSGGDTVTHPRPRVGCSSRCRGALTTWRKWRLGAEEEAATVIECAAWCCSA